MLRSDFLCGLGELKRFGLTYDLLIYPKQLPAAIEVLKLLPEQLFVLDHMAKPPIKSGAISPWKEQLRELASFPNVWCKVSGLVTEADGRAWKPENFKAYLDVVFEAFGEDRLMFGSDWPVCLLSATYEQVLGIVDKYCKQLSTIAHKKVFGENALKFYGACSPDL